jgi:DNA invertase Pin-like site-specific DNA recombinase
MDNCLIYARVSSKEQESEGFSIPAQIKLLNEYAIQNGHFLRGLQRIHPHQCGRYTAF